MRVELSVETTDSAGRTFLTWAPVQATARLAEADGAQGSVTITLRNGGIEGGGRIVLDSVRSDDDKPEIEVQLPSDGTPVDFWVAGEFRHSSKAYGDAAIEAVAAGIPVGRRELMVRIRKDAVILTAVERDRFLAALGKLNDAGHGVFQKFRDTHVAESQDEAHGFPGFPPWHRAYLLDLERTLQEVDDTVTLPYWRFDRPAKALFAREFLGMPPQDPDDGDAIDFPAGHPLEFWKTDVSDPIRRRPRYRIEGPPPPAIQTPQGIVPWVVSEADTIRLGLNYADFRGYDPEIGGLEFAPHGTAHVSFQGPVNFVPTAAKDPLFFLLHCNVDRLWAKWQWYLKRWDPEQEETYSLIGDERVPNNVGHKLADSMWPWNGIMGDGSDDNPRPEFPPPRQPFPNSPVVSRPGPAPSIRDMIDYQGLLRIGSLGFDYDDVPFELPVED